MAAVGVRSEVCVRACACVSVCVTVDVPSDPRALALTSKKQEASRFGTEGRITDGK